MRRNEAHRLTFEATLDEEPMEPRVARIEGDVAHIRQDMSTLKTDVRELRLDIKAANESIADVKVGVAECKAGLGECRADIDECKSAIVALHEEMKRAFVEFSALVDAKIEASVHALESRLIKWMVGTVIASTGAAFSVAKFVH